MKENTPFDAWLERRGTQARTSVARSAPEVRDMLEGAWKAAQSVFGKRAAPEHAVMLLPIFLARADAERQQLQDEAAARSTAGSAPPAARRTARGAGHRP